MEPRQYLYRLWSQDRRVGVRHEEIDIFPRSLSLSVPAPVLGSEYINIFCYFCGPVTVCFLPALCFHFRSWPTVPQIRLWWMFVWYRGGWTTFSGSERNWMGVKSRSMITWNTSGCCSQGEMIVGFTGKRFFAFAFGLAKMLLSSGNTRWLVEIFFFREYFTIRCLCSNFKS